MPTNKSETVVPETAAEGEAKPKRVRKPAAAKLAADGTLEPVKKAPRRKASAVQTEAPATAEQSALNASLCMEEISVRAYFIGEHRRSLGRCGDSEEDWLEAERQLRSEALGIAASLRRK